MPNRFTTKATAVQLREALEALELDSRGKKDTLLKSVHFGKESERDWGNV